MRKGHNVTVVIPAHNEEAAIGDVVRSLPDWVDEIVVADNASTDETKRRAKRAGARVVDAPTRGYGSACQAALATIRQTDLIVFMDGDGSDNPDEMALLVDPLIADSCDIVIGSRSAGNVEAGAMTMPQIAGNWIACFLIRLRFGVRYTDLGPFRSITWRALQSLDMNDADYGWTVQLQLLAITHALRVTEVPVTYRRRIGVSKISGTWRGVVGAGTKIIWLVLTHRRSTPDPFAFSASQSGEASPDRLADPATTDDKIAASRLSHRPKDIR